MSPEQKTGDPTAVRNAKNSSTDPIRDDGRGRIETPPESRQPQLNPRLTDVFDAEALAGPYEG